MSGVRLVWRDLKRTIRGVAAFVYYLVTRERIGVGLGWLAADAGVVVISQPSRYVIHIANACAKVWQGMVVIDITPAETSDPLEGRYASYAKRLTLVPCSALRLEIQYDWLTQMTFVIDGHTTPPDEFHQGMVTTKAQRWAVHARLVDGRGERLDQLTIYQGMKG